MAGNNHIAELKKSFVRLADYARLQKHFQMKVFDLGDGSLFKLQDSLNKIFDKKLQELYSKKNWNSNLQESSRELLKEYNQYINELQFVKKNGINTKQNNLNLINQEFNTDNLQGFSSKLGEVLQAIGVKPEPSPTQDEIDNLPTLLKRLKRNVYGMTPEFTKQINTWIASAEKELNHESDSEPRVSATTELVKPNYSHLASLVTEIKNWSKALNNPKNQYFPLKKAQVDNPTNGASTFSKDTIEGYRKAQDSYDKEKKVIAQQDSIIDQQEAVLAEQRKKIAEKKGESSSDDEEILKKAEKIIQSAEHTRTAAVSAIETLKRESEIKSGQIPDIGGQFGFIERHSSLGFDSQIMKKKDADNLYAPASLENNIADRVVITSDNFSEHPYVFAAKVQADELIVTTKTYSTNKGDVQAIIVEDCVAGTLVDKTPDKDAACMDKEQLAESAFQMAKQLLMKPRKEVKIVGTDEAQIDRVHAAVLYIVMQNPKKYPKINVSSVFNGQINRIKKTTFNPLAKQNFIQQHLNVRDTVLRRMLGTNDTRDKMRDQQQQVRNLREQGEQRSKLDTKNQSPVDIRTLKGPSKT